MSVLCYLMGGPQVSLMVWVVTPSPRRLRGTSSGFTFTATRWLRRPSESSLVRAATATEYWKYQSQVIVGRTLMFQRFLKEVGVVRP